MSFPTREKQIQVIAKFLDSDRTEGRELTEVAEDIVNGFHSLLRSQLKSPYTPHVGAAFNHPSLTGVWYVAHEREDGVLWIVNAKSSYGAFIPAASRFWVYAEESKDGRRPKKILDEEGNETGEVIPLGVRPGLPGHNPDWAVGDQVSRRQRQFIYDVVATGDKCVLLKDVKTGLYTPESNASMEQYYRRENGAAKTGDDGW